MFDYYREKTPGEILKSRAAYPQILALLMVSGVSSASLFSHHLTRALGIVLYGMVFALLCWSLYLARRAKRLIAAEKLHT